MYLAMNRFKIFKGNEEAFEEVWRNRDSRLKEVPGFVDFHLMRGPSTKEHTLYASHTIWADEAAFTAWTKSEHFRASHRNAGSNDNLYDGSPTFEGFTPVLITGRWRGDARLLGMRSGYALWWASRSASWKSFLDHICRVL